MTKQKKGIKPIVENRRARYEYHINETYEAGLALVGTEVKSLRLGMGNLQDSYVKIENGEAWAINFHISTYEKGNQFNHDPKRQKKLLLHKREILKLKVQQAERGMTLIPLKIYFKEGRAKMEVAVAIGKKMHDKRDTIAERDVKRQLERVLKDRSHED